MRSMRSSSFGSPRSKINVGLICDLNWFCSFWLSCLMSSFVLKCCGGKRLDKWSDCTNWMEIQLGFFSLFLWLFNLLHSHFTGSYSAAEAVIPTLREQHSQVSNGGSLIEWRFALNLSISCLRCSRGESWRKWRTDCWLSQQPLLLCDLIIFAIRRSATDLTYQEQSDLSLSQSSINGVNCV